MHAQTLNKKKLKKNSVHCVCHNQREADCLSNSCWRKWAESLLSAFPVPVFEVPIFFFCNKIFLPSFPHPSPYLATFLLSPPKRPTYPLPIFSYLALSPLLFLSCTILGCFLRSHLPLHFKLQFYFTFFNVLTVKLSFTRTVIVLPFFWVCTWVQK